MNKINRTWAKNFSGTIKEFIAQAERRNFTARSIRYWVKFNWNITIKCNDRESMDHCKAVDCSWFNHSQVGLSGGDYPPNYKGDLDA